MRNLVRGAASLAFVMFVVSCSGLLKKKEGDAGAEGASAELADAAAVPGAHPLASNEGDIARFPDETKLADVHATLLQNFNVREAPPAGVIIMGLPKGTGVTQVAQRDKSILILFDNPKSPGTTLMGWIHRDAFSAAIQDAGPLVCAKGEVPIFGDTPLCGKLCSADADCPAGQGCKGSANKVLPNGKVGDGVTVCSAVHGGGGAAPDAGHVSAAVDAGHAVVDAGKPVPPTGPAGDVVAANGGKCPATFVLVSKTGKCHRSCANGKDQPERLKNCGNANPICIKCDKDLKFVCAESQTQCR
jgi:hypothetical protein